MRKKRTITVLVLSVLAASVLFAGIRAYISYSDQTTGTEWFYQQEKYIDEMEDFSNSMDDIFALYISGSISKDDFVNHLNVLKSELKIMESAYKEYKDKNPVKTGSHTYSSKKGCESVEGCYTVLNEIITMAEREENYSDIETLSYKYLACQQDIIDYLADYMAASEIIKTESEQKEEEQK